MPEEQAAAGAAKGGFGFLAKKAGPLPLGVWAVLAAGVWWWTRRGTGTGTAGTTDPAGNTGTINPSTGYVYGSAADQAAQAAQAGGGSAGGGSGSGSTQAGQYADNNAWSRAAINYLVARGVDPTQANEAVMTFLSSAPLTPAQQADVNLAIQALGPPPTLPGPVGAGGSPIVTPPAGGTGTTTTTPGGPTPAPVTGLAVAARTRNTISLKWNRAANATGYVVHWGPLGNPFAHEHRVVGPYDLIGGLSPGTTYAMGVSAENGGDRRSAFADISASTTK